MFVLLLEHCIAALKLFLKHSAPLVESWLRTALMALLRFLAVDGSSVAMGSRFSSVHRSRYNKSSVRKVTTVFVGPITYGNKPLACYKNPDCYGE